MPAKLENENRTRLDTWLWAARFFKTRAIAARAISSGKVHLKGQKIKPARRVNIDECYEVRRGQERMEIIVLGLSERRGPAQQAQALYTETDGSIARRAHESEQRKLAAMQRPVSEGKPTRKERGKIRQFSGKA